MIGKKHHGESFEGMDDGFLPHHPAKDFASIRVVEKMPATSRDDREKIRATRMIEATIVGHGEFLE